MVGQRRRELNTPNEYDRYDHVDLENGNGQHKSIHPRVRFRDAVEDTMDQKRAKELKKKLLGSMDYKGMEKFRKSDEEVRSFLFFCLYMPTWTMG